MHQFMNYDSALIASRDHPIPNREANPMRTYCDRDGFCDRYFFTLPKHDRGQQNNVLKEYFKKMHPSGIPKVAGSTAAQPFGAGESLARYGGGEELRSGVTQPRPCGNLKTQTLGLPTRAVSPFKPYGLQPEVPAGERVDSLRNTRGMPDGLNTHCPDWGLSGKRPTTSDPFKYTPITSRNTVDLKMTHIATMTNMGPSNNGLTQKLHAQNPNRPPSSMVPAGSGWRAQGQQYQGSPGTYCAGRPNQGRGASRGGSAASSAKDAQIQALLSQRDSLSSARSTSRSRR
jgi:hypothetical protein